MLGFDPFSFIVFGGVAVAAAIYLKGTFLPNPPTNRPAETPPEVKRRTIWYPSGAPEDTEYTWFLYVTKPGDVFTQALISREYKYEEGPSSRSDAKVFRVRASVKDMSGLYIEFLEIEVAEAIAGMVYAAGKQ